MKKISDLRIPYEFIMVSYFVLKCFGVMYYWQEAVDIIYFVIAFLLVLFNHKAVVKISYVSVLYYAMWVYFIFITLISFVTGNVPQIDWVSNLRILIGSTGICMIFNVFVLCSFCNKEKLINVFKLLGIFLLLFGIAEYFCLDNVFRSTQLAEFVEGYNLGTSAYRIRTIFYHPILCAVFLVMLWCMILYKPYKNILLNTVILLALVFNLYVTQSRSSWLSFVLINLLAISRFLVNFKSWDKREMLKYGKILLLILVIVGGGVCLLLDDWVIAQASVVKARMAGVFTLDISKSSNAIRLANMANVLKYCKSERFINLIWGNGAFYSRLFIALNPVFGWNTAIDNQYLSLLLNYGVIGVLMLVAFGVFFLISYFKSYHDRIRSMVSLSVISILISAFFYEALEMQISLMMLTLCLGLYEEKRE